MKVTVDNETYLVHWETRKFRPKKGKNTNMELESTDCIVRLLPKTPSSRPLDPVDFATGHVSQTACDQANSVVGRRLSLLKAFECIAERSIRKAIGHEYNRTCRVIPRTSGDKIRSLKKRIAELEAQVSIATTVKEEVVA